MPWQKSPFKHRRFLGIPALGIDLTSANRSEKVLKIMIDYIIAIMGLVLTLPLWLIAAAGIKLVSPQGPVFYTQTRVGQNGREFTLYKFRTMIPEADRLFKHYEPQNECDGPVFKMRADPRILPLVGPLLRKTSLDELPQLINVLRGELSIVGPRPPLLREVACYQHWQRRRLSVKPGITCFWQIQPNRNDIGFNEWIKMDLAYIDNWSLWLDLKIMLRTAWVMVTGNGR
jgi:lipopolysaccharide/colanic/teichoic acid biosynthesis glycosyltransferase